MPLYVYIQALWPEEPEDVSQILSDWDDITGDRRQELVFIGTGLKDGVIQGLLEKCILSDAENELGCHSWGSFVDPFPISQ